MYFIWLLMVRMTPRRDDGTENGRNLNPQIATEKKASWPRKPCPGCHNKLKQYVQWEILHPLLVSSNVAYLVAQAF